MKKTLTILVGALLVLLTASANLGARENLNFNPKDPQMRDVKIVNDILDTYITKKDKSNIERVKAYTQDRSSKYALLIMIEFNEDLSMEKLEAMRQRSPKRWEVFQSYFNKALAWLSLSRKAENFLGGNSGKAIKKELGEK